MINAPPSKRLKTSILSQSQTKNDAPDSFLDVARATTQVLAAKDAESRQVAARAVATACDNTEDAREIAPRDAVHLLAEMLRAADGEAEAGALALSKLARNWTNGVLIANSGTIPPLVSPPERHRRGESECRGSTLDSRRRQL